MQSKQAQWIASGIACAFTRMLLAQTAPPANQPPPDSASVHVSEQPVKDMAPGWPIALPGAIVSTPVLADMTGDGKLSVIVNCVARDPKQTYAHPHPVNQPMLYAIRMDGNVVPNWPTEMGKAGRHDVWGGWASSPSVVRVNGKDELVLVASDGKIVIVRPDLSIDQVPSADPVSNVPVVDLNGDGKPVFICGRAFGAVEGTDPVTWTGRHFRNGYAPAIGDAAGEGKLRIFHLFYTTAHTNVADLTCFDRTGKTLAGWPRVIDDPSWHAPVIGDLRGTGKMDVVGAYGTHLFAWDLDGNPLPNTTTTTNPDLNGILVDNISAATASPALADLDGDGKAEIILFDHKTSSIRAWHGDGTGFANADGTIAAIPEECYGVSVVSLGDNGEMDFFTGHYWVRRQPDGTTEVINMLPDNERAEVEWTQPTVADAEGTGQADVLFGLSDGRLYLYQTHLAYHREKMQWPTANQNFQHTGAWPAPKRR